MRWLFCVSCGIVLITSGTVERAAAGGVGDVSLWLNPRLRAIESQLAAIDQECSFLPPPLPVPDYWRPGFIMTPQLPGQASPWVEIVLPEPRVVDTVVLFPLVMRGTDGPLEGFGFPKQYRILAETGDAPGSIVLLDATAADVPSPGMSPVIVRCPRRAMTSVKIEVVKSWRHEILSMLALAEVMLFDGNRNVAIDATATTNYPQQDTAIGVQNLLDMRTPLGLPALVDGSESRGFQSQPERSGKVSKSVTVDLGEPGPIDEVRLVPVSREGPDSFAYFGFPQEYHVEVSLSEDFAGAQRIEPPPQIDIWPPGPNLVVLPCRHPGSFRYVRVTTRKPWPQYVDYVFALAELQVYRGSSNVALGCRVEATDATDEPGWSPSALTDGHAYETRLIDLPDWAGKIAAREVLHARKTDLIEQRTALRARHDTWLGRGLAVGVGGVLLALVSAVTLQRRRLRWALHRMREQIARDLHDDIGSNLASIGLISRFLSDRHEPTLSLPAQVLDDASEIGRIAEESSASMRDIVAMIAPGHGPSRCDWSDVLVSMASRILRGVPVRVTKAIDVRGGVPDLTIQRELYLFAKEVVTNVVKHAGASVVDLRIETTTSGITLEIKDDGRGFEAGGSRCAGHGLANLVDRARAMHALLTIDSTPGVGTVVRLHGPLAQRRLFA